MDILVCVIIGIACLLIGYLIGNKTKPKECGVLSMEDDTIVMRFTRDPFIFQKIIVKVEKISHE